MKNKSVLCVVLLIVAIALSGCVRQQTAQIVEKTDYGLSGGKTLLVSGFEIVKVGTSDERQAGWYATGQRVTKYQDGEMGMVGRSFSTEVVTGDKSVVISLIPLGDSMAYMNARTEYTLEPFTAYQMTLTYNTPESGKYQFTFRTTPSAYGVDGFEFVIGDKPTRYI